MSKLNALMRTVNIHVQKINLAIQKIGHLFPMDAKIVRSISDDEEFSWIEVLVTRFSKLQDFIGNKLMNEFLLSTGDSIDNMTVLDKIHKLEKLGIIENEDIWMSMRNVRNHLTHEYPDHPELTAQYLNQMFNLVPNLLNLVEQFKKRIPIQKIPVEKS